MLCNTGVHNASLHLSVATDVALITAKRVAPAVIGRLCWPPNVPPHAYWIGAAS